MKTFSTIIDFAEKQCQKKDKNLTKKRKTILLALLESKKAISAYELADYCKNHFNEVIPVMSIYRILDFLQAQELAHRLDLANKYVACAHIACDHQHHQPSQFLICNQCQRVEEIKIDSSVLNRLQSLIHKAGFHLNNPQLEFKGTCKECT